MPTKKRGSGSRDLGLSHGAGKGDADRSNPVVFKKRFPKSLDGKVKGFVQQGNRLVKVYGRPGRNIRTRTVSQTKLSRSELAKVDGGFAVAQALADAQNAKFRAAGFDTQGH